MRGNLDLIAAVLRDTPEPVTRSAPVRAPRRWLPAAVGLSAADAVLLVGVEVAVWRAVTPLPPSMQPQEVAAILSDVSASLFSLSGELGSASAAEESPQSLEAMAREVDSTLTGAEP